MVDDPNTRLNINQNNTDCTTGCCFVKSCVDCLLNFILKHELKYGEKCIIFLPAGYGWSCSGNARGPTKYYIEKMEVNTNEPLPECMFMEMNETDPPHNLISSHPGYQTNLCVPLEEYDV